MEQIILYLIVGAIYLFLNSKKAKDKKKGTPQTPTNKKTAPTNKKQPETFGELFESLFGETAAPTVSKEKNTEEQQYQQREVEKQRRNKEANQKLDSQRKRAIELRKIEEAKRLQLEKERKEKLNEERKKAAHLRSLAEKAKQKNKNLTPAKVVRKKKSKFNLREAIIAQVILERPYQ